MCSLFILISINVVNPFTLPYTKPIPFTKSIDYAIDCMIISSISRNYCLLKDEFIKAVEFVLNSTFSSLIMLYISKII